MKGESTKRSPDWKEFMTNEENKQQLIEMLYKGWSQNEFAGKFQGQKIILIVEGKAYQLTSVDEKTTIKADVPSSCVHKRKQIPVLYYMHSMAKRMATA